MFKKRSNYLKVYFPNKTWFIKPVQKFKKYIARYNYKHI